MLQRGVATFPSYGETPILYVQPGGPFCGAAPLEETALRCLLQRPGRFLGVEKGNAGWARKASTAHISTLVYRGCVEVPVRRF